MKNMIIAHNGSIQNIPNIPANVKAIYKTVWEISQKKVLDLHLPVAELECASASSDDGTVDEYAFLWMEEGLEDGDVLPEDEACRSGDSVYCGPGFVEGCEEAAGCSYCFGCCRGTGDSWRKR